MKGRPRNEKSTGNYESREELKKVVEACLAKKMTYREITEETGISTATIYRIRTGDKSTVKKPTITNKLHRHSALNKLWPPPSLEDIA